jgi:hypothetical protein
MAETTVFVKQEVEVDEEKVFPILFKEEDDASRFAIFV